MTPIKYSKLDNVQFNSHGFLGSRQEVNYRKQPLEEILLASEGTRKAEAEAVVRLLQLDFDLFFLHELFIPPHQTSKAYDVYMDTFYNINRTDCMEQLTPRCIAEFFLTLVYRDGLGLQDPVTVQDKINMFLDEMIPSIVDSASIVTAHFESIGFEAASLNQKRERSLFEKLDEDCGDVQMDQPFELQHYRPIVPPPDDQLSSLILSQFLDRLLNTKMWTHLISHWHYRDSLNWFSIVHGDSNRTKGMGTKEYFGYFDVALKGYLMERRKLRVLRDEILEKGRFEELGNSTMSKEMSFHQDKKRKSIVVVQNNEKKHVLRCGFDKPWQIRWCRDTTESVEDLQNALREAQMISVCA